MEIRAAFMNLKTNAIPILIAAISLLILAMHANYYMPFISDDALITLRYAKRLLQGFGLTWTEGQPVEGYSNLLWLLMAALFGWIGVDLIQAVRILGFVCFTAAMAAIVYAHFQPQISKSLPLVTALLTFALAAPVAIWTIGGLEQPLVAALLAWTLVLCRPIFETEDISFRRLQLPALLLALLCLTRPDGALFTAAVVLTILLTKGINYRTFRIAFSIILLPVIFYLGQLGFRLMYYGEWVPNTALVKISFSLKHLLDGLKYIKNGFTALSPLSELTLITVIVTLRNKTQRARIIFLLVPALIWIVYLASIGGDIFPGWRQFVPIIVLMGLILAQGALWFEQKNRNSTLKKIVPLLLIGLFALYSYNQLFDYRNRFAKLKRWEWDGQVIGLLLKKGFGQAKPLLATTIGGCIPFWSELPTVDMLGLNDYHIPRHPPENFGQGWIGHELGDGEYVLNRKPDLIILTRPQGRRVAIYLSGKQMQTNPEFFELYTLSKFEGRYPYLFQSLIWVRHGSPKVGIIQSADKISVPCYLINGNKDTAAFLDQDECFVISISAGQPAYLPDFSLPPGQWRIEVKTPSEVYIRANAVASDSILAVGPSPLKLGLPGNNDIRLNITLYSDRNDSTYIRELIFDRIVE